MDFPEPRQPARWLLPLRLQQGKSHIFPLGQIIRRTRSGEISHPVDESRSLRNADGTPGVEDVKGVRTFETVVIGGEDKTFLD